MTISLAEQAELADKIKGLRKIDNCPCGGEPANKKPFAGRREEISPLPAVPA